MKMRQYYRRFALLVTEYPRTVIAVVSAITVLLGIAAFNIKIDPDPWKMIPEEDPAVVYWQEVEDLFGKSDAAIVAVVAPETIYNPRSLEKVDELTRRLEEVTLTNPQDVKDLEEIAADSGGRVRELLSGAAKDGLTRDDLGALSEAMRLLTEEGPADAPAVHTLKDIILALDPLGDVMGLSTVENIESDSGMLATGPIMERVPTDADGCRLIREKVRANRMLSGEIVSNDETATIVFANLTATGNEERTTVLYDKIQEILADLGGPEKYYVSGSPMILSRDSEYMKDDMGFLIPLVILLIMVFLFFVFRNVRGMITPLLVVLISVVWTLGLMALLKVPISILSTALPVVLVAIGCADGIHIITHYYGRLSLGEEKRAAIVATMEDLSSAVIMTSLTSMAGFAANLTSSLTPIREFGLFTAFGIGAAMIFSLSFIPAMMMVLGIPKRLGHGADRDAKETLLTRFLDRMGTLVVRRRAWILLGLVPAFAFVIFMTSQVEVGYGFIKDFRKTSEIRIADNLINEKFPGSINLNVVIDSGTPGGAKDPEFLAKVQRLQEKLEADPMVGGSTSIVDFLARMNYVMHDNDPAYRRLPNRVEEVVVEPDEETGGPATVETVRGRDLVAQYILLYENSGGSDIEKVVDFDYQKINVVFQLKSSYSRDITHIEREASDFIATNFHDGVSGHLTGSGDLIVVISHYIIKSQIISLITSMATVLLMLIISFWSLKGGLFAMTPIFFTIFMNFTLMKVFGVTLDVATAMIASMGVGIGIDYSIHFVARYRVEYVKGRSVEEALSGTMHDTGKAIVFNAVAVAAGFLVLVLSNFKPIGNVGWLVAATMLVSAGSSLVILPVLIRTFGLFTRPGDGDAAGRP
jgi:predicted RND superfamily exporter protein